MKIIAVALLESSYDITLITNTDAEISILLSKWFSEKKNLSLLSNQMRQIFDLLYQALILGKGKLDSSTVDKSTEIMWATLQGHEVMAEFSKQEIKRPPPIIYIFVRLLVTDNISEHLQ